MELKIYTPMEADSLPLVRWNNEELKAGVAAKMQEFKDIAYTEDDAKAMKADKADINKFVTAIENERKRVKNYYAQPYEAFEAQVKEVLAPAREVVKLIDANLQEIEVRYRDGKKELCRKYYTEYVGDLRALVPFEKTVREEFYKRAFTEKKLSQAYQDMFAIIQGDMDAIDELESPYKDKILLEYAKNLSLQDALREGKRLEELDKAVKARKAQQEEERKRKEAEQKQASRNTIPEARGEAAGQPVPQVERSTIPPMAEKPPEDEIMTLDFRVKGTRAQLMALRQYMIDNGLKFGKVE